MFTINYFLFINLICKIIFILICIAFFTIAERKVMAAIQRRKGPNVVGIFGLLQPIADGFKLIIKERVIPIKSNWFFFLIAPLLVLTLSFMCWVIVPFTLEHDLSLSLYDVSINFNQTNFERYTIIINEWNHFNDLSGNATFYYGILVLFAISSLNVYGIILAGWSSYSKYAFFGALRSAAQMISYEVSLTLVLLPIILLTGSLNFTEIIWVQIHNQWFLIILFPSFILFLISMVAETNRAPFDLPEAEAELVAGYNVEYSSIIFAMFFLGEYGNMIIMSSVITIFFCGGWANNLFNDWIILSAIIFIWKILIFCYIYILIRASLPRYRYDQLMDIGWKSFLPVALSFGWAILTMTLNWDGNIYQYEILNNTENLYNNFIFQENWFLSANTNIFKYLTIENILLFLVDDLYRCGSNNFCRNYQWFAAVYKTMYEKVSLVMDIG